MTLRGTSREVFLKCPAQAGNLGGTVGSITNRSMTNYELFDPKKKSIFDFFEGIFYLILFLVKKGRELFLISTFPK